jgi:protein transport protein SEC61 subunit alpha
MLMDEVLEHGYGLGSGLNLFIAVNITEYIVWQCFSPITIKSQQGTEFEGCIVALYHFFLTKANPLDSLKQSFQRQNAPNIWSLVATMIVVFLVIYLLVSSRKFLLI